MTRKFPCIFVVASGALACTSNAGNTPLGSAGAGGTASAMTPASGTIASGGAQTSTAGAQTANGGAATSPASGGTTPVTGGASTGAASTGGSGVAVATMGGSGGVAQTSAGGTTQTGTGGSTAMGPGGSSGAMGSAGETSTDGGATSDDDDKMLIPDPSWTCGMPDGIPPPTTGKLVLEADVTLGNIYDIGDTQYGHRHLIEISGGTVKGPNIDATLRTGGLDWQLTLTNGALEVEEVNILTTTTGAAIYLRNCGTAAKSGDVVRTVPDFEAPSGGPYDFLNTGKFVGTRELDMTKKTLKLTVYDVSMATPPHGDAVKIVDPAGLPNQTWDCKPAAGTKGATVYMESVGIGDGSVTVGASKRGTRNIIPITGGTTTGRIAGSVLAGGADFQLIGTSFVLDARYTLHTSDGEYIIVRNCGPLGALVPVFETRKDGNYAWVNDNHWLSSDPTVVPGAVDLTIYEGGM